MPDQRRVNKSRKNIRDRKTPRSTPPLTVSQPALGQPVPDSILRLQGLIGNQAVQRLVMGLPEFYEQAGAPQQDVIIPLGFTDLTVKARSVQYMKIMEALKKYHELLEGTVFKPTKIARAKDAEILLKALEVLKSECNVYLLQHKKAFVSAEKTETKLNKDKKLGSADERELKRNRTFTRIVNEQIPADQKQIMTFADLENDQVAGLAGDRWKNAVFGTSASTGDLNSGALKDDIAALPNSSFKSPGKDQAFGAQPNLDNLFSGMGGAAPTGYYATATLLATDTTPITTPANQLPNVTNLYQLGAVVTGFSQPDNSYRLTNTPATAVKADPAFLPDNLFIGDDKPHADEIAQGQLGDCYFLAALTNIVNKDPDRVKQMMRVSDSTFSVDFYYRDPKNSLWKLQRITLPRTLLMANTGGVKFAGYKMSTDPASHQWWVTKKSIPSQQKKGLQIGRSLQPSTPQISQQPTTGWQVAKPVPQPTAPVSQQQTPSSASRHELTVNRRDNLRAALWMPYLEKAYLRFAQEHGQYGTGTAINDKGKSGFDVVNEGGSESRVYPLFYGGRASSNVQSIEHKEEPPPDLLVRNRSLIIRLLQANDAKLTDPDSIPQRLDITASASKKEHTSRAAAAIDAMMKNSEAVKFLQTKLDMQYGAFGEQVKVLQSELEKSKSIQSEKAEAWQPLAKAARDTVGSIPPWSATLHQADPQKPTVVTSFIELAVNLVSIGTDHSAGQRNIYSKHAYTVVGATFNDNSNTELKTLSHADLRDQELKKIDLAKSIVKMRNPHGANTPDIANQGESERAGSFDLTLEQFIRNFSAIDIGTILG